MKLQKAIETLDVGPGQSSFFLTSERLKALSLGIEALKRVISIRNTILLASNGLLPGETDE